MWGYASPNFRLIKKKSTCCFRVYKAISRRRVSSPLVVQQLWDAIHNICSQRQQPNIERISRYMSRVHGISEGRSWIPLFLRICNDVFISQMKYGGS
jgi:hypothetical protein